MTTARGAWVRLPLCAALVAGPAALTAQVGARDASAHPVVFYSAKQNADGPPDAVDPSTVPALRRKVSVDFDGVPVHDALQKLSRLSGLHFIYAEDVVDPDRVLQLRARDVTVATALTELLGDTPVAVVLRSDGNAILAPAAGGFALHDTTSEVRGTVTDSAGNLVQGADVYVITSGRDARTNDAGVYSISGLLGGPTRLRARLPGWQAADTAVALAVHSTTTVNFVLQHRAPPMDTVRVVSGHECPRWSLDGFECRRRLGVGVFRDARELTALTPVYFADLFDGVPGVRRVQLHLDVGIEATTKWRCIAYLENGRPPFWKNAQQVNFLDVVAFEFYEDPDEVPEWYKGYAWRGNAPCSLVVLWLSGAPEVAR